MNEFFYNLFYILVPVITVVVPIVLSMFIYRKLKGKEIKKVWLLLAFIPIVLAISLFLIPTNL